MRRAARIAIAVTLAVASACAPKPEQSPTLRFEAPPKVPPLERLRGRVHAQGSDLILEPCGGGVSLTLTGRTRDLRDLLGELARNEPGAAMFAMIHVRPGKDAVARASPSREVADVVHAAPEGRGCDIDWSAFRARAMGNEPFWSIDVLESSLVLRRPDHADRILPCEASRQGIPGVFDGGDAIGLVRLELTDLPCRDGMSGAYFEMTATATVDGETLRGCALRGQWLKR